MNNQEIENKEEPKSEAIENQDEKLTSNVYATKEIEIEEVAIDGICGVY
jgi:mycofactocin precursor